MSVKAWRQMVAEAEQSPDYWRAALALEFAIDLACFMEKKGVDEEELARRLGKGKAWLSKVLNGTENLSLEAMAKIAMALGGVAHMHIAEKGRLVDWKEAEPRPLKDFLKEAGVAK